MSLAALTRTEIATTLGVIPLWHADGALQAGRPAVLFINRLLAPPAAAGLATALASEADLFWMQMPGDGAPYLARTDIAGVAAAVSEAIGQALADRPLVLAGQGAGAAIALAVRGAPIARLVAIEPELEPATAWPVLPIFRKLARERPAIRPLVKALYGALPDGSDAPSSLGVLDDLAAPADVLVGEEPLFPQRPVKRPPSLVGEAVRERLRGMASVKLHVAPRAGSALLDQAAERVVQLLRQAAISSQAAAGFDPAVLIWTPLAARNAAYVGKSAERFVAQYARLNPSARLALAATPQALRGGPFDLIVAGALAMGDLAVVAASLATDGVLVASLDQAPPADALERAGLSAQATHASSLDLDRFDDADAEGGPAAGRVVLVARRGPPAPRTRLRIVAYAQRMMDVRTRLPAQALRNEPSLAVAYQHAPIGKMRDDTVFVLQRPAERQLGLWRTFMDMAISARSIIVLENDDHPEVINKALNRPTNPEDLEMFRYAHAVQTSTPELAALFGRYNPNVEVFPNAVFDLPPFPQRPWTPRIFYGALARGDFPAQMARSLDATLKAFPDAAFEVVGDRGVFDALPTANKRFHGYMAYEAYLDLMAQCSILLTPLEGAHYETKSDTKFLDAASRGLSTIASPTAYGASVRHGDNGLIVQGLEGWAPALASLLADPAAAAAMAHRAWSYVRDERMFAHQSARRRDWYAGLMARREALNAAAISRIPGLAEHLAAKAST